MNRKNARAVLSISALALLVTGGILFAGPLDPPAGAVSSTYKSLTEVEPRIAIITTNTPGDADSLFKITQAGSYYLTGNITGVAGKHGIEIIASGVTLDLNGFDLVGVPAMGAFDGVSVTVGGLTNIAVVNGSVRNWGDDGIDLGTISAINCRVAEVLASANAGHGISTGTGGTVWNCSAYNNTGFGVAVGGGCTVSNCSAYNNTGSGITAGFCCTVSNCSAYSNAGSGISTSNTCIVAGCAVRLNTLDGIVCASSCVISGNTCSTNGNTGDGAAIHATGSDTRIEGNTCAFADRGIDVDGVGNIIVRNTCSGNTINWNIVAGNVCLVVQGIPGAAIMGNAGGAAPGSTDPNANFTY